MSETDDVLEISKRVNKRLRRRRGIIILGALVAVVVLIIIALIARGVNAVEDQGDRAECVDGLEVDYEIAVGLTVVAAVARDPVALAEHAADVEATATRLEAVDRICG